jgi:glycosyltransferase involved in cell wall biosynthesis
MGDFVKIAIIHDWLTVFCGAEKVLEAILELYPHADLFSIVDFLPQKDRLSLQNKKAKTSFIQKLPFSKHFYRHYLPLMPLAIEQFNLSSYDLILSSSHCVAKGIITGPGQLHICYCHSPIRYAWDLTYQYLKESGLKNGIKGICAKILLHKIRLWDRASANGVDFFIANSNFIASRIQKIYRRDSAVIYPPVNVNAFSLQEDKDNYYFTASRFVAYKKIDLIVEAFRKMPGKRLIIIGDGPDFEKIYAKKPANVEMMGYQPFEVLKEKMQKAKAFIFAAIEDFGIAPIEAQACGTPVIAFAKGGLKETTNEQTGLYFFEQTADAIKEAVILFENNVNLYDPKKCRENALRFSKERFKTEFKEFVDKQIVNHESISTCRR